MGTSKKLSGKGTEVMWCQDFKDQPGKYDQTD